MPSRLVKAVYELRMTVIEGEGPNCSECVSCGRKPDFEAEEFVNFGLHEGGVLCDECRAEDSRAIHRGTLYAMQYISSAPVEKLFAFTLSEERCTELCELVRSYLGLHVDKKFKSEELFV